MKKKNKHIGIREKKEIKKQKNIRKKKHKKKNKKMDIFIFLLHKNYRETLNLT
jgi:hypothetical protein